MVLVVGNNVVVEKCPDNLEAFLSGSARLKEDARAFSQRPVQKHHQSLLYVQQHEMAVTHPDDPEVRLLGSEDATTCHVAVFRHPVTGVTALAHFDLADESGETVSRMAERVFEVSARLGTGGARGHEDEDSRTLEVSLVGGFEDDQGRSEELSLGLLKNLIRSDINFILALCCIGSLNTKFGESEAAAPGRVRRNAGVKNIPRPVHFGCSVDVGTGEICPAKFGAESHGPENILRHIRCSFNRDDCSKELFEVYDCQSGAVRIDPFRFQSFAWLHLWIEASSADILENFSTSPDVEPEYFVAEIKAAMKFIIDNPDPHRTVFKEGKSLIYKRDVKTKKWTKID